MSGQVDAALGILRERLGDNLIGVYPHGSSVVGGLRPASDLDLLAVVRCSLDRAQRVDLVERLRAMSGPGAGGRSLEVTVVVRDQVVPWRYPPVCDFLYGEWLVEEFERDGPPNPFPEPNLAIEITQLLAAGQVLHGPEPAAVLAPVPAADLVRASVDGIDGLLADLGPDTRNVLLTLARIWFTVETGSVTSKDAAATWAGERLPPQLAPALAHARWLYLNATYAEETWPPEVRAVAPACAEHIVARVRGQR